MNRHTDDSAVLTLRHWTICT